MRKAIYIQQTFNFREKSESKTSKSNGDSIKILEFGLLMHQVDPNKETDAKMRKYRRETIIA